MLSSASRWAAWQSWVRSGPVVVPDVLVEDRFEVAPRRDEQMVAEVLSHGAHQIPGGVLAV